MGINKAHKTMQNIRKPNGDDIAKIADIWLEASIVAHDFIKPQYWLDNKEVMEQIYLPNSQLWIYEDAGEIQGFIAMVENHIAAIFVAPNRQGLGIGQQLMAVAKAQYPNVNLCVYTQNTASIRFYHKQGFKMVNESLDENTGELEWLMQYPMP